jgi:hypothetical protein
MGDSPTLGADNAIPRSGSNNFSGTILANGSKPSLQSNNLMSRLQAPSPTCRRLRPGVDADLGAEGVGQAAGSLGDRS